jgi:hypothetical protein
MNARKIIFLGIALAAAGLGGGCASAPMVRVRPWEREQLADEAMNSDRDSLGSSLSEHVHLSREASSGGRAVGGAGCGCN